MDICEKINNIVIELVYRIFCVDVWEYNLSMFKDDVSKVLCDNCVWKVWVFWSCSEVFVEEIL